MQTTADIGYSTNKGGIAAVVAGSSLWGLFWIPLHYLESQGLTPLWALVMIMLAAFLPAFLLTVKSREFKDLASLDTWITGFILGLATTLYFVALAYTDVIRVIFLFYLLPLWTTLTARLIYGEPIRAGRIAVMLVALSGLWLLLGGGHKTPIPESIGDWCAIASGLCWAISLSLLHANKTGGASSRALVTIGSSVLLTLLAALMVNNGNAGVSAALDSALATTKASFTDYQNIIIAACFGVFALYPALLAQIWGARRVPAPTAALLTMSEIVVAIGSAALLIGTDLSLLSLLGGMIILLALCLDIVLQFTDTRTIQPSSLPSS